MGSPARVVGDGHDPNDLLDIQRIRISRAQAGLALRQRRIVRAALTDLEKRLGRIHAGTWTEAEQNATRILLGQSLRQLVGDQTDDLSAGLREVTKMSAKDAARFLATMDKAHLGAVRPLRFDSLEWWERTDKRIGQVRLREFSQSFQRYGAQSVAAVEDAISKRILLGESWDKAREEVWEATRGVVQDRRWMVDRIVRTETAAAYSGTTLAALYEEDTDDEPMLKKLVATFDSVTGMDSHFVHGQTKKLTEQFVDDHGRHYDAPPNRPHDREIVVGWRKSWGAEGGAAMSDFDEATATPRDYAEGIPPPKLKLVEPPPPVPEEIPFAPAADLAGLERQLGQLRAQKAAVGFSMTGVIQSRIKLPRGISHPPESVASVEAHNVVVDARVFALRREVRAMQQEQARIEIAIRHQKKAKARAKAVGAEPPEPKPKRLPKPTAISKVDGPGEAPKPKKVPTKKTVAPKDLKAGQWTEVNGVPVKVDSVRDVAGIPHITVKVRGRNLELPLPPDMDVGMWSARPKPSVVKDALDEARELSQWAVQSEVWFRAALNNEGFMARHASNMMDSLARFNAGAKEVMIEILEGVDPKKIKSLQVGAKQARAVKTTGKGSESAKLKRYAEAKGLGKKVKVSGLEKGMATEMVSEISALHDGLAWRADMLDSIAVVNRKKGRDAFANALVQYQHSRATGRRVKMELMVNKYRMGTRDLARAQWFDAHVDVKRGKGPYSVAGYFDDEHAKFRSTIRHEYGHAVDFHMRDRVTALEDDALLARGIRSLFTQQLRKAGPKKINAMSRRAVVDEAETWAEAFALAVSGKWDKIPDELHQPLRLILFAR